MTGNFYRSVPSLNRTLGPVVIRWIEAELCHGPGDVQGDRIELDDEIALFLLRAYEVDDRGRRVIRRAVFSRSKGRMKSELLAMVACVEALGPARFNGWGDDGRPVGRAVRSPLIKLAATEEGQAGDTYSAVEFMLNNGPISRTTGLDVGMTRTFLPGGGAIKPITAKATSKDGGRESFVGFDETHLYVPPELIRLHATMRRNLTKRKAAEPWAMETSTMYAPEEGSVAESSHRYAEAIAAGTVRDPSFLFDHRQGASEFDFADDDLLRAALMEAYGAAAEWIDVERMILEARDPQTLESDFRRYFLNVPTERTEGKWIADEEWRACQGDTEIPPGAEIVVGVDAAHTRDTTAAVWSWRDPDTDRIVQRSKVWSCVEGKPADVFVPGGRLDNDAVRDFVRDTLAVEFKVVLVLGDERYFADQLHELSEGGLTVVEMVQGSLPMNGAWDEFYQHVHAGPVPSIEAPPLEAEGGATYAAHVRNALGVKLERGWVVRKKAQTAPIDCVAAGAMSAYGVEHRDELAPPAKLIAWSF